LAPLGCAARAPAASTPEPPAVEPRSSPRDVPAGPGLIADALAADTLTSPELALAELTGLEPLPSGGRCPERTLDGSATPRGTLQTRAVASQDPADALDATTIRSVVRSHSDGFMGCYQLGLGRDPNLQGRVTTRFDIDPKGKISDLTIADSDLFDCAVIDCIRDHFVTIEFPPPGSVVTVLYPLVFGHAD
jgi:hypothetical protein